MSRNKSEIAFSRKTSSSFEVVLAGKFVGRVNYRKGRMLTVKQRQQRAKEQSQKSVMFLSVCHIQIRAR